MPTQPQLVKERVRKPKARRTEIVIGALQERILAVPFTDDMEPHRDRVLELLDELSRSINRGTEEE